MQLELNRIGEMKISGNNLIFKTKNPNFQLKNNKTLSSIVTSWLNIKHGKSNSQKTPRTTFLKR